MWHEDTKLLGRQVYYKCSKTCCHRLWPHILDCCEHIMVNMLFILIYSWAMWWTITGRWMAGSRLQVVFAGGWVSRPPLQPQTAAHYLLLHSPKPNIFQPLLDMRYICIFIHPVCSLCVRLTLCLFLFRARLSPFSFTFAGLGVLYRKWIVL